MVKRKAVFKIDNIKLLLLIILEIGFFFLFCLSTYHIINWLINTSANKKIKESLDKIVVVPEDYSIDETIEVDFKKLKELNSDSIAYIRVPSTNISYVVVKGIDNDYYLKHNFEKKWNIGGWIFGDYHNRFDGTDKNLIIYGHNMRDGSMFETLKNVLDSSWYQNPDNHIILLVTENGNYNYKVFSTYSVTVEDYYIKTDFSNENEFQEFINSLKSRSNYDYGTSLSNANSILTLSSCIGDGRKRVVLHALLEKEE